MTNLRQRYRDYLSRLEGAGSPRETIQQGLQVPSPMDALRNELSRRTELRPEQANYLLLGNIGTGKTLQLMLIEQELRQSQDVQALYLDVSQKLGLVPAKSSRLVRAIAITLIQEISSEPDEDPFLSGITSFMLGRTRDFDGEFLGDIPYTSDSEYTALRELFAFWRTSTDVRLVLLIDGLDRLASGAFATIIDNDLPFLREIGLGTIMVGPPGLQYDDPTGLQGKFERISFQPVLDPNNEQQATFLFDVLRQRASADVLPDEPCRQCVAWSGGLLRDLLLLAQLAGEEAYVHGSEAIDEQHVTAAAHHLGEKMARALIPSLRRQLSDAESAIALGGAYTGEAARMWAELLSANLLLSYGESISHRYDIHPCLRLYMGLKAAAQ